MEGKKIVVASLMLGLPAMSLAGLDDYTLRRLPATLGNEFMNPAGNIRHFVPTSVNDAGLLAGFRLTFVPEGGGGTSGIVGEVSYIYDLNTRTYVAKTIRNISITYIGDQNYIGKRLTRNGSNRWQTLRCPLSGLIQNTDGTWSNNACDIIDNDLVDNYTPLDNFGFRSELYHTANVTTLPFMSSNISTPEGSSFVVDIPDNNDNHPDGDEGTIYFSNGDSYHFVINEAPFDSIDDGAYRVFESGGNVSLYHAQNDEGNLSAPSSFSSYTMSSNGFSLDQEYESSLTDSTGYVATPLAISRDGKVVTTAGYCASFVNCAVPDVGIDMWAKMADAGIADPQAGVSNPPELLSRFLSDSGLLAVQVCSASDEAPCAKAFVMDLTESDPDFVSPFIYSEQKFGEVSAVDHLFPMKLGYADRASMPQRIHMSPNGDYIVAVTKLNDGRIARYSFVKE